MGSVITSSSAWYPNLRNKPFTIAAAASVLWLAWSASAGAASGQNEAVINQSSHSIADWQTIGTLDGKTISSSDSIDSSTLSSTGRENTTIDERVLKEKTIIKKTDSQETTSTTTTKATESSSSYSSAPTTSHKHPIVALALGGGGPRGAAHLGVLKVFRRENIPVDMIVGTSMGAIFGGLYCAGLTPEQIEEISNKHMARAYYTVPIPVRIALIPLLSVPHLFGYHPYDGLYRGNKFAAWLDHAVPEAHHDVSQFQPRFAAVAANLLDGKPVIIDHGDLGRALQASSAIPFLRRPVFLQNKLLVDGGILANIPVKQARQLGADFVIAVDVDETFDPPSDPDQFRKIGSVPPRVISMILAKVDQDQIAAADVHFQPNVNGISLLTKKVSDAHKAMLAGEAAAEAALPEIRRKLAEKISIMSNTKDDLTESIPAPVKDSRGNN